MVETLSSKRTSLKKIHCISFPIIWAPSNSRQSEQCTEWGELRVKYCLSLLLRALPQNSNLCVLPPEPLFTFRTANLMLSNTIRQLFDSNISSELECTKNFRFLKTMVLNVSLSCFLVDLKITKNNRSLIGGITPGSWSLRKGGVGGNWCWLVVFAGFWWVEPHTGLLPIILP